MQATIEKRVIENRAVTLPERVRHVVQCCFGGRRIVIFSEGLADATETVLEEIRVSMQAEVSAPSLDETRFKGRGPMRSNC
jgi:hypothetical protein